MANKRNVSFVRTASPDEPIKYVTLIALGGVELILHTNSLGYYMEQYGFGGEGKKCAHIAADKVQERSFVRRDIRPIPAWALIPFSYFIACFSSYAQLCAFKCYF